MSHGYYYPHLPYPHPSCYYDHQHYIFDNNNNFVGRNPYPFDGPYFDRRMVEPCHQRRPYPYYDSRYCLHGRVDPYTSYRAHYETPLLAYPQPPSPPKTHPFYDSESMCAIM